MNTVRIIRLHCLIYLLLTLSLNGMSLDYHFDQDLSLVDINSLTPVVLYPHEITFRNPQRIDRGKMPQLLPDYYSDGEETKEYHCIRTHCAKLIFNNSDDLQQHYKEIHKLLIAHICKHCRQKCDTAGHLQEHIEIKHTNLQPVKCRKCKKEFQTPISMRRHLREVIHQSCPKCKKILSTEVDFIRHLREAVHQ